MIFQEEIFIEKSKKEQRTILDVGFARVDEWANDFRIERRISLPRALVLLSIPKESWQEPPRQQYVSAILEFFEKRTASLAQRGPLVRMLIGKSSSRVDLAGVAGKKPTASSILEHLSVGWKPL